MLGLGSGSGLLLAELRASRARGALLCRLALVAAERSGTRARQGALRLAESMATGDLNSQCGVWSDFARLSALVQTMAVGARCKWPNQSSIALMPKLLPMGLL